MLQRHSFPHLQRAKVFTPGEKVSNIPVNSRSVSSSASEILWKHGSSSVIFTQIKPQFMFDV